MTARRFRTMTANIAQMVLVATMVTACSSTNPTSQNSETTTPAATASAASRTTGPSPTRMPTARSDFPDGVYRTQLSADALLDRKVYDLSDAGTWTLTVKGGTYRLDCRAISDPTVDCGNSHPSGTTTVELGTLHGASPTVWFSHDMARLANLNGCSPHSTARNGCGPEGGYHIDWREVPDGIAFSNFVGLGDESGFPPLNNWTVQPWTRLL